MIYLRSVNYLTDSARFLRNINAFVETETVRGGQKTAIGYLLH
jgi:hypothetical protein